MKEIIDIREIREMQMCILDTVDAFCREIGIDYSLSSGSLIGAVRHQGYIPWDDDIDIYMLRKDYEVFLKSFNDYSETYKVFDYRMNKEYDFAYAKVIDIRTYLKEPITTRFRLGINIDVFPIDGVPNNVFLKKLIFGTSTLLRFFMKVKYVKLSSSRSLINNCTYLLFKLLISPISYRNLIKLNEKLTKKSCNKAKELFNFSAGISKISGCFPIHCMASFTTLPFEDRMYRAMSGYNEYLQHTYGDFMELPPLEKQVPLHNFKVYWKD